MKIKNISTGTYKLMGLYSWAPGETLDVPDKIAAHVLEAQAGRFVVVVEQAAGVEPPHPVKDAPDRMQRKGWKRG